MAGKGIGAKTATGWTRPVMSLAAQSQSLLTGKGTSVSAVLACLPPAAFPPALWEGFVVICFGDYCLFLYVVFLGHTEENQAADFCNFRERVQLCGLKF